METATVKTANDVDGLTGDTPSDAERPTETTMTHDSRDTSREFEYHLRQAYHLAERDEVRYHIRQAAAALGD